MKFETRNLIYLGLENINQISMLIIHNVPNSFLEDVAELINIEFSIVIVVELLHIVQNFKLWISLLSNAVFTRYVTFIFVSVFFFDINSIFMGCKFRVIWIGRLVLGAISDHVFIHLWFKLRVTKLIVSTWSRKRSWWVWFMILGVTRSWTQISTFLSILQALFRFYHVITRSGCLLWGSWVWCLCRFRSCTHACTISRLKPFRASTSCVSWIVILLFRISWLE
jgi:hypothetical protein